MDEQKQPSEMTDEELNIAIAKAVGYWVYHYDKDYAENCYYMLCAHGDIDWVGQDDYPRFRSEILERRWKAGERKTEEEAWKDAPYFTTDLTKIWPLFKQHKTLWKRNYFPKSMNSVRFWLDFEPERAARLMSELFMCQMEIKAKAEAGK